LARVYINLPAEGGRKATPPSPPENAVPPVNICKRQPNDPGVTAVEPRRDIEVRTAVRADLLDVFRIEKRSFDQPWPYAAFEQFLGSSGFLVAEDDTVVGYVVADTIERGNTRIGHIKDIAVAPTRRGEGIGRTLLTRGITTLASASVDRIKLEVRPSNRAAQSLYESFGFEPHHVRPGYYDDGEDARVLVRRL
jgi:ribosomal-protein-alanine N-acetyltransferase